MSISISNTKNEKENIKDLITASIPDAIPQLTKEYDVADITAFGTPTQVPDTSPGVTSLEVTFTKDSKDTVLVLNYNRNDVDALASFQGIKHSENPLDYVVAFHYPYINPDFVLPSSQELEEIIDGKSPADMVAKMIQAPTDSIEVLGEGTSIGDHFAGVGYFDVKAKENSLACFGETKVVYGYIPDGFGVIEDTTGNKVGLFKYSDIEHILREDPSFSVSGVKLPMENIVPEDAFRATIDGDVKQVDLTNTMKIIVPDGVQEIKAEALKDISLDRWVFEGKLPIIPEGMFTNTYLETYTLPNVTGFMTGSRNHLGFITELVVSNTEDFVKVFESGEFEYILIEGVDTNVNKDIPYYIISTVDLKKFGMPDQTQDLVNILANPEFPADKKEAFVNSITEYHHGLENPNTFYGLPSELTNVGLLDLQSVTDLGSGVIHQGSIDTLLLSKLNTIDPSAISGDALSSIRNIGVNSEEEFNRIKPLLDPILLNPEQVRWFHIDSSFGMDAVPDYYPPAVVAMGEEEEEQ